MNIDLTNFIGPLVVSREVEYKGKTMLFHFRELSAGEAEDLFLGAMDDGKPKKGLRAKIIATILCDAEGNTALSAEEVSGLPNSLATKLQDIALDINQPEKDESEKN